MKKNISVVLFGKLSWFLLYCSLFVVWGCASLSVKQDSLAVVDGENITRGDLEYALNIAHRREDLSSARKLDITEYVNKLVDEKLLVQEARRAGLETLPEIKKKLNDYLVRESVVRLYDEEVLQKATVNEKEIADHYYRNYETFFLNLIESKSEEDTKNILARLNNGEKFSDLAESLSTHPSKKDGGAITFTRNKTGFLEDAIEALKPGEISGVVSGANKKFYVVKLIERGEAPADGLDAVRNNIESNIRSVKVDERSTEYLEQLKEGSGLKIDRDLLLSIDLELGEDKRKELLEDKRQVVQLNDTILTVGEIVEMFPLADKGSIERKLNIWIDRKVVDDEALSRHYERNSELNDMMERYKNQLLMKAFISKAIISQIRVSEEDLRDYYSNHKKEYIKPFRYKIQQISVKTSDEGQEIIDSLNDDASFSWLARTKSIDGYASHGGAVGWQMRGELAVPVRNIIDALKPGEKTPVLKADSSYIIIGLQDKSDEEFEKFEDVRELIYRNAFRDKYNEMYTKYIDELKKDTIININKKEIESFQERFGN